jgi:hypothetical protein
MSERLLELSLLAILGAVLLSTSKWHAGLLMFFAAAVLILLVASWRIWRRFKDGHWPRVD